MASTAPSTVDRAPKFELVAVWRESENHQGIEYEQFGAECNGPSHRLLTVGASRSQALSRWTGTRAAELDRMEAVHTAMTGTQAGRRWDAEYLNGAIIARLIAEFQGFARDLHSEAVDHVVDCLGVTDTGLRALTRAAYLRGRELNSGNPTWNTLKNDFRRIEVDLQTDIDARYVHAVSWRTKLQSALFARNAIVHADEVKLLKCRGRGDLTLGRAKEWRSALGALASGMDQVTGAHLRAMTGTGAW